MGIRANTNVSAISGRVEADRIRLKGSGHHAVATVGGGPAVLAAGLRGIVRGQQEDLRAANDGVALVHTAQGWLDRMSPALARLRELAVLPVEEASPVVEEAQALVDEIDRISTSAEYGGTRLLDGSASALRLPIAGGSLAGPAFVEIALPNASPGALGLAGEVGPGALPAIDAAILGVATARTGLAAATQKFAKAIGDIPRGDAPIRDPTEAHALAVRTSEAIVAEPRVHARATYVQRDHADAALLVLSA